MNKFIITMILLLLFAMPLSSSNKTNYAPTKYGEKLIFLYALRIEEAKNDVAFDKAICEVRKADFEMYNRLEKQNAETKKSVRDVFLLYQQARINKEASEIALEEVKVLYELMKELVEQDKIKPQDTLLLLQERPRTRVR